MFSSKIIQNQVYSYVLDADIQTNDHRHQIDLVVLDSILDVRVYSALSSSGSSRSITTILSCDLALQPPGALLAAICYDDGPRVEFESRIRHGQRNQVFSFF